MAERKKAHFVRQWQCNCRRSFLPSRFYPAQAFATLPEVFGPKPRPRRTHCAAHAAGATSSRCSIRQSYLHRGPASCLNSLKPRLCFRAGDDLGVAKPTVQKTRQAGDTMMKMAKNGRHFHTNIPGKPTSKGRQKHYLKKSKPFPGVATESEHSTNKPCVTRIRFQDGPSANSPTRSLSKSVSGDHLRHAVVAGKFNTDETHLVL